MNDIFPDIHWTNFLIIPGMLLGFTVHELGHAFAAYYLGDNSQIAKGRITLNPLRHVSLLGSIAFLLTGYLGWPKPFHVDPLRLKRQYFDLLIVSLAGPLASFTLSLVGLLVSLVTSAWLIFVTGVDSGTILALFFPVQNQLPEQFDAQAVTIALTGYVFISSFWLTLTSLLPLPGFDGFTALVSLFTVLQQRQQKATPPPPKTAQQPLNTDSLLFKQYKRRNRIAEMHFKAGTAYHDEKKYDDAIVRYRQAIQNDVHFGPAYINMGLAYLGKGKRKEAIQAYRGATQYADDPKSQAEAWQQLHKLSEVSPTNEDKAQQGMAELGAEPWTDTQPQPDWLLLGIGLSAVMFTAVGLYLYLLMQHFIMLTQ